MAKKANKKTKKKRRGDNKAATPIMMLVLVVILAAVAMPTFILLCVGLIPSIIAMMTDNTKGRYRTRCMFGLNFSGVAPYALDLWATNQSVDAAMTTVLDPTALMVIWGASGVGWIIFLAMPPVVATFLNMMAQRRVAELRDSQKKLLDAWGDQLIHEMNR